MSMGRVWDKDMIRVREGFAVGVSIGVGRGVGGRIRVG